MCHDSTNTEACDYDGGDCCLDEIVKACDSCICHEDGLVHPYDDPWGKESPDNTDWGIGRRGCVYFGDYIFDLCHEKA